MNRGSEGEGSPLHGHAVVAAVATGASKTTYAGGTTAAVGWLLQSEVIAAGGLLLAIAGFGVNLIFKLKEDRRQQAMHDAKMQEIQLRVEETRLSRGK